MKYKIKSNSPIVKELEIISLKAALIDFGRYCELSPTWRYELQEHYDDGSYREIAVYDRNGVYV